MAEVLGIISGSIAIGQALSATRLAVVKLRQLRSELHHLPDEIEELIEQIEFIGLSLEMSEGALREQRLRGASPNLRQHDANHRIITRCHRVLEDLGSLADRIKDSMCSRSVKGRVKAMLQKDDLERLRARMEQAIRVLTLSQSICTGLAVTKMGSHLASIDRHMTLGLSQIGDSVHNMETKMVLIESSNDEKSKETPSNSQATSVDATSSSHQRLQMPWVSPSCFGQIRYERKPGFFEARVVLPGWVTQFAWDLQVRRAATGWNVWFEPFLHDPTESQIENLIQQNRVNELDYLYRRGRMAPKVGGFGMSIFMSAIRVSSIDVALMFQNHLGRDKWSILDLLLAVLQSRTPDGNTNRCFADCIIDETLGPTGPFCELVPNARHFFNNWVFTFVKDKFNLARTIKRLWGNYETLSVKDRIQICALIDFTAFSVSSQVQYFCNFMAPTDEMLTEDIIKEAIQEGANLLVPVSYQWGISFGATERRPSHWSDMIRTIIKQRDALVTGSFLHTYPWDWKERFLYSTPLSSMIRGIGQSHTHTGQLCDNHKIQNGIFDFLELLLDCGIDLVWYGKEVKKQIRHKPRPDTKTGWTMWEHITCSDIHCDYTPIGHQYWDLPVTLSDIEYGPSPRDWKFFWETDYGCLQVFWGLVEWQAETELTCNIGGIPGAWPQEQWNFRVFENVCHNRDLL